MKNKLSRKSSIIISAILLLISVLFVLSSINLLKLFIDAKSVDYYLYWTTGRVVNQQENPFDSDLFLARLREFEPRWDESSVMYYLPWVYPLFMLMAVFPYSLSHALWFVLGVIGLLTSGLYLWKQYNLTNSNKLISLALVVSFCPVAFSLFEGQINTLMFFALVGFLYFQTRKQDFLSGLCAIFLTIKPNTIYLVLLALAVWVFIERKWKFVFGALTGIIVLVVLTLLVNHQIFAQYIVYMREIRPGNVLNTSIYGLVSHLTGKDNQLAFYLPVLAGLVFFVKYGSSRHFRWSWRDDLPILIVVSLVTTPYAWVHDEVLFIFPLLQAVGLLLAIDGKKAFRWIAAITYTVLNIAGLILIPRYRYEAYDLLWIPVVISILYGLILFVSKISPKQDLDPKEFAEAAG